MGEYDNLYDAGKRIVKEVERAVDSGNYSNLSSSLRTSIEDAVRTVKANPSANFNGRASTVRTVRYASAGRRTPFFTKTVGVNAGIGKVILGIVGASVWGMGVLGALVDGSLIGAAVLLALTLFNVYLIKAGSDQRKLSRAFNKYGKILGRAEYFAISDLAMAAGERSETILSNIKKMIDKDYLPTARIDNAETTVMLSERAYAQYLQAEKARQEREFANNRNTLSSAAKVNSNDSIKAENTEGVTDPQARAVINEGKTYIAAIQRLNDAIPGDEMSAKIYQLETIMRKIFTQVENDPGCADDLKKFMNYYLPTTIKLLEAYADLDKQPEVGNNITQTKKEIEDAIDVINEAFENLLDSLFQDMAWDISSDISVMKTMMAQDGLTEDALSQIQNGQAQTFGGGAYQTAPAGEQAQEGESDKVQLKF